MKFILLLTTALFLDTAVVGNEVALNQHGCNTLKSFQLVSVNTKGKFVIPSEAKEILSEKCFKRAFHLVGVAGPFHTGKSFMLNALVNRSGSQFEVGETTESTTRGLWIHGAPVTRSRLGENPVVFLDTEGFAGTENTEQHDAKIYAISTLISAHQLFNTIRNIDAHSIEMLELLARRARLLVFLNVCCSNPNLN